MESLTVKSTQNLELIYQLLCDDVRLELGNKLSFMGVFQDIYVQQLPFQLPRIAVVNHWRGNGKFLSEVRILYPGKQQVVAHSTPTLFEVPEGGYANNITFFMNLAFERPGEFIVQTLIDSNLFAERRMIVGVVQQAAHPMPESAADDELLN
ncbi:MAG TPA: hypothetical protein PLU80_07005 [Acidobacteriota bacterium]|nr:hypothetical protein [Acidobacteriota bacterium]HNG93134.1 hypothetical protein [Acidobacteriota bacterium]